MLDERQAPDALGPDLGVVGDECADVQLREGGGADREFSYQRWDVGSDQHAGIEDGAAYLTHGSWTSAAASILYVGSQVRTSQHGELARQNLRRSRERAEILLIHSVPYEKVRGLGFYRQFLDARDWPEFMRAERTASRQVLRAAEQRRSDPPQCGEPARPTLGATSSASLAGAAAKGLSPLAAKDASPVPLQRGGPGARTSRRCGAAFG